MDLAEADFRELKKEINDVFADFHAKKISTSDAQKMADRTIRLGILALEKVQVHARTCTLVAHLEIIQGTALVALAAASRLARSAAGSHQSKLAARCSIERKPRLVVGSSASVSCIW
jgi:hypothetical protein